MLAITSLAVLALSAVSAAPVPTRRATAPTGWASSYLESYDAYHTRYVALGCAAWKAEDASTGSAWDTCCHPLLAGESLSARPAYCSPSDAASSSAAAAVATDASSAAEAEATAAVESVTEQAAAATTSAAAVVAAAEPTTTSSTAAAATTTAASSSGSGSVNSDAYATYFLQNGNAGACGNVNSESSHIVAIPYAWWGTSDSQASEYCGKSLTITRASDGATVEATVADLCPTCTTDNSLDLSVGAFTSIASESEGMVEITWQWN